MWNHAPGTISALPLFIARKSHELEVVGIRIAAADVRCAPTPLLARAQLISAHVRAALLEFGQLMLENGRLPAPIVRRPDIAGRS